jgi:hypothetical protein
MIAAIDCPQISCAPYFALSWQLERARALRNAVGAAADGSE